MNDLYIHGGKLKYRVSSEIGDSKIIVELLEKGLLQFRLQPRPIFLLWFSNLNDALVVVVFLSSEKRSPLSYIILMPNQNSLGIKKFVFLIFLDGLVYQFLRLSLVVYFTCKRWATFI